MGNVERGARPTVHAETTPFRLRAIIISWMTIALRVRVRVSVSESAVGLLEPPLPPSPSWTSVRRSSPYRSRARTESNRRHAATRHAERSRSRGVSDANGG